MALLDVRDLKIAFYDTTPPTEVVKGISFSLEEGETLGIVGESGSGKTQTALSILHLLKENSAVSGGEILYEDSSVAHASNQDLQRIRGKEISMIFQEPMTSLNPLMTVGQQLEETLQRHEVLGRRERRSRVSTMLDAVKISHVEKRLQQYPHELSGGMRQRIMIAMALACNPRLIIADEPTTALDVTIQAQILDLLRGLKDKINSSIMLITHDLGVVAEMADYVVVMYAGRVVEKGTAREIFKDPRHPYTIGLMKSKPVVGKYTEKLYSIPGSVPNPIDMPNYCYFKDRCEMCVDGCEGAYPGMYQISPTHFVSCYRCAAEAVGKEGDTKNEQ